MDSNSFGQLIARLHIVIRGAVQGVGFRPFVYRMALRFDLTGWVSNSVQGIDIEAEGLKDSLDKFLISLQQESPRHASIQSVEYSFVDATGSKDFQIRESSGIGTKRTLILPDIATCADCLSEVFSPSDRRYLYPFTNCTHCGPRFTIIESLPYDRANTTMRRFSMCRRCRSEYEDPFDRRFHAQPNACPDCGPHMELWDTAGKLISSYGQAMNDASDALKNGLIVAAKGLGGFHLMVDATNEAAVLRLRSRKHREEKPFALMARSLDYVRTLCRLMPQEEGALSAPASPIVILSALSHLPIAAAVAPGNPYLGVMLPYTPLHHILMGRVETPVVATSGNRADEPIAIDEHEAVRQLRGIADMFLVHDRPIRRHADDSIVRILLGRKQILRRARGYAPLPIVLKNAVPAVTLAVGGHLKNTVALAIESQVFISQHIGDLATKGAFDAFRQAGDDLQTLYETHPKLLAGDMHPDYASTSHACSLASSREIPFERTQHHWAHVLSCMADNGVDAPVLGVAWDGSGYGPDGTIWGGEFLRATGNGFRRVAHLRTFPLPGGEAAIKKPKHAAIGLLYDIHGAKAFNGDEPPLLRQMLERRVRILRTSSAGRLFDAVASLIGLRNEVSFEGQAAMELEFCAAANVDECYEFCVRSDMPLIIDWEPMIHQIRQAVRDRVETRVIAAKFHNTLTEMIVEIALRVGERRVLLTGGCFQNRYLTERTIRRLEQMGFLAYSHQRIPTNDGGIALGQIVGAALASRSASTVPIDDFKEAPCVLRSRAE